MTSATGWKYHFPEWNMGLGQAKLYSGVVDADEVVGSTDRPGRDEVDAAGPDR